MLLCAALCFLFKLSLALQEAKLLSACWNPVEGPCMQQHVPWFGWSLSEPGFSSEVGQTAVASGKWCIPSKLWNPLFQAEHTHAWSDSCGNWTLQVVRIFQSLAGRTCLNPLNFSKQDAGGRVRSWQGNSGSSLAQQARLAEAVPSLSALAFRSWHWAMPDWPAVSLNGFCVCDTESCSSARVCQSG